jgi:hypothetical protein
MKRCEEKSHWLNGIEEEKDIDRTNEKIGTIRISSTTM